MTEEKLSIQEQNPVAFFCYMENKFMIYRTEIKLKNLPIILTKAVFFEIPIFETKDKCFSVKMKSSELINWIVKEMKFSSGKFISSNMTFVN